MKKTTIGILFIGLLLMASSVSASDDWWNTSYQYRVPITLAGNTSGSQTNYQLMLNVSYTSNMQPDFDDLRFTDDSGNLQSAWLEDKTNDSWADIWVNFTSTPDNGVTQTYYMYYGNTEVSDYWNGNITFLQFGENKISSYHLSNNISYPCILEAEISHAGDADQNFDWGLGDSLAVRPDNMGAFNTVGDIYGVNRKDTTETYSDYSTYSNDKKRYKIIRLFDSIKYYYDGLYEGEITDNVPTINLGLLGYWDTGAHTVYFNFVRKYAANPPTYGFGSEEEYTLPAASETPTPTPTPTPLEEITSSNYVIQNQTLYITKPCNLQYKITSNSFVYGGLRNINTVICDNNNTVISGWFKISTDQTYDADYTFLINVNDTSYESKIITIKQKRVDSSIISKTYRRSLLIDGYEIYNYNTTVYIVSILPNPIYFYFNLEDRTIQFGDKQFNNQTLVFNQLNFDDQYEFMNNASSDTVVMKFKAINPEQKSGAELKGLTGILLNALSKIPFIGKSFKNVLYYPLFFIQTIFDFVFTFLDLIVNDWWYGLMLMEIVCIFAASRNKGYANVMEVYIDTHVKIIKFIYEWIILKTINLIITIVVTIKDMIKWW